MEYQALRNLRKGAFVGTVKRQLWQVEFDQRRMECRARVRLNMVCREIAGLARHRDFVQRTKWPGAPYRDVVDDRYHVRMLAITRLGLLPIEVETGRWGEYVEREQRLCSFGCGCVGDTQHFLTECRGLAARPVDGVYGVDGDGNPRLVPPSRWRGVAVGVAMRFQERARKLQHVGRWAAGEEKELLAMRVQAESDEEGR